MTPAELANLIASGEDSQLEFKRDDVRNHDLAKELVAFLNVEGGTVLLGVGDDGSIVGTSRSRLEEWVSELCRAKVTPPVIPLLSWARQTEAGQPSQDVLAVSVAQGPDKPYALFHNNRKTYYVRVGSTSQEASREELQRLFQASGRLRYGLKPAPGTSLASFDRRRLRDYFTRVSGTQAPDDDDVRGWETLLCNLELMTVSGGIAVATIDGQLLFGSDPTRFVRQSGIRAVCYAGRTPDYPTRADEDLRGPLAPLGRADGGIVETGMVEQAWDFMRRNTQPAARIEGGRRIDHWEYPETVFREAIVNALVHRDYSIAGTDILLAIYADRVEIESPGRLPNTVTISAMRSGMRYARNQTLANVMRDYGYVDARGMGVRSKMIPGMRTHNGTEPDLIEDEMRFVVRLWRTAADRQAGAVRVSSDSTPMRKAKSEER